MPLSSISAPCIRVSASQPDVRKQVRIPQRSVQLPAGVVDAEFDTKRVEIVLASRPQASRHLKRIDHAGAKLAKSDAADPAKFMVEKSRIKGSVVNYQFGALHELDELCGNSGEARLVGQKLGGQAVDRRSTSADFPFRVQISMEMPAGAPPAMHFYATDFDNTVAATEVEAGGFSIEDDAAHECA